MWPRGDPAEWKPVLAAVVSLGASIACFAVAVTYIHVLALARGLPNAQFMMAGIGYSERPYYYAVCAAVALVGIAVARYWVPLMYCSNRSRRVKLGVVTGAAPIALLLWSLVLAASVMAVESRVRDPFDDEERMEIALGESARPLRTAAPGPRG